MTNPYEAPQIQECDDEKNVKGGFFASESAKAVECLGAWISLDKRYLRVKYLPNKSKKLVLIIFCIAVILLIPFAALGGLGAIILYAIINTIIRAKDSDKIEFSLDQENLLIDSNKKIIGVHKKELDKTVFIGTKVPQTILDSLKQQVAFTESNLKKGTRFIYQLIAVSVWLGGLILGVMIHKMG